MEIKDVLIEMIGRIREGKNIGLCNALIDVILSLKDSDFKYQTIRGMLKKYRPNNYVNGYWFPQNEEGKKRRIEILTIEINKL